MILTYTRIMVKNNEVTLGDYLKSQRKQQRITQVDLSKKSGLSKSYISFLETNLRHPSRETALILADILKLSPEERDHLLVKAGYAPLNSPTEKTTISKPKVLPEDFSLFMQDVLQSIRQGEYAQAQAAIEVGFGRYNHPAEMQTLLAHLELSKGNFDHAILSQETALKHAQLSQNDAVDYWLNLGVMHFLKGDDLLFTHGDSQAAKKSYAKALSCYASGEEQSPENLYLLDELARVHFNLADLSPPPADRPHWEAAYAFFKRVLTHPDHQSLQRAERITSSAFLGLSCAKLGHHQEAEWVLTTLKAVTDPQWMIDYIQVCTLCLHYQATSDTALLSRAKHMLLALLTQSPEARAQAILDQDKDLSPLSNEPAIQKWLQETSHES